MPIKREVSNAGPLRYMRWTVRTISPAPISNIIDTASGTITSTLRGDQILCDLERVLPDKPSA